MDRRWYQEEAKQSFFDYYNKPNPGNALIALPTGTGKGYLIADWSKEILFQWPNVRVLMLTHVKELIAQNSLKLKEIWPTAPLSIYSSGLKKKELSTSIIFAGVGSVYKRIKEFGHIDILFIDEAHLLSPDLDTMYGQVIKGLKERNPNLIITGFTATPFRMGQGMLTEGGIFNDIIYDLTDVNGFNRLINDGYMVPIYPKPTHTKIDTSAVKLVNGDFDKTQLERATDRKDLMYKILEEFCYFGSSRHCWIYFAAGVNNAEHVAAALRNDFKISAFAVHSKIDSKLRDSALQAYRNAEFQCLVCYNVGTTGFDHPPIDYMGMGRATMSPGLWAQMAGRMTRPSLETGKTNGLLLDFAKNALRLGPINDLVKPKKKGEKQGDMPVKECPNCGIYNHLSARFCICCNEPFPIREKLNSTAGTEEIMRASEAPQIEFLDVHRTLYNVHVSKKNPNAKPCLKVSYLCGLKKIDKYYHFDIGGLAGHEAREWWRKCHPYDPPTPASCTPHASASHAALSICRELKEPKRIKVIVNRQFPEVVAIEY